MRKAAINLLRPRAPWLWLLSKASSKLFCEISSLWRKTSLTISNEMSPHDREICFIKWTNLHDLDHGLPFAGWNLFIYFSPVKIRGWHPNNQHTIYLGTGRGMFWWKLKKSRETSRRALDCFVHSFQNLDKTSAAVLTKCQFENSLRSFPLQHNTFKE